MTQLNDADSYPKIYKRTPRSPYRHGRFGFMSVAAYRIEVAGGVPISAYDNQVSQVYTSEQQLIDDHYQEWATLTRRYAT